VEIDNRTAYTIEVAINGYRQVGPFPAYRKTKLRSMAFVRGGIAVEAARATDQNVVFRRTYDAKAVEGAMSEDTMVIVVEDQHLTTPQRLRLAPDGSVGTR
jgi:hypothetical protein